jgi:uncharacterized membrane protein YvbJ
MNDKIDLDKVLDLAKKMKGCVEKGEEYSIDYDYLKEHTPKLYDLILAKSDNFMEILDYMVKKLKEGKKTEEKASEDVGEFLAQRYIYPNIDMSLENQGSSSRASAP